MLLQENIRKCTSTRSHVSQRWWNDGADVPDAFRHFPLLQGRATVEVVVEKPDGAPAFVDSAQGGLLKQGKFEMTLDGFSAPVTAGAFAKLVNDAKYDGSQISTGYLTVVGGKGVSPGATIPLEILPIGMTSTVSSLLQALVAVFFSACTTTCSICADSCWFIQENLSQSIEPRCAAWSSTSQTPSMLLHNRGPFTISRIVHSNPLT